MVKISYITLINNKTWFHMTAIQSHFFGPQLLDYNDNDLQQSKTKGVQVSYFIINSYHKLNIFEFFCRDLGND